eukprot:207931-Karenia_brevis.AAC.1
MGRVLHDPCKSKLRKVAFHGNTLTPQTAAYVRRVGRPRHNWTEQVLQIMRAEGPLPTNLQQWNHAVERT